MKKLIFLLLLFSAVKFSSAQEKEKVERACLNYIEGFYEGDTTKLIAALKPSLHKIGYWKNKNTGVYDFDGQMTYRGALDYAKNVMAKKNFAKPDAPKKVEVFELEIQLHRQKLQPGGVLIMCCFPNKVING